MSFRVRRRPARTSSNVEVILPVLFLLHALQVDESYIPTDAWRHERNDPSLQRRLDFREFYTLRYQFVVWNCRHPVLRDKRIRRALAMSVSTDALVRDFYYGSARAITGPLTPEHAGYNHRVAPVPYAPNEARRLLAVTGWTDTNGDGVLDKNGQALALTLLIPADRKQGFPEIIQAELRKIGVQLDLITMENTLANDRIYRGQYDAAYMAWTLDADPDLETLFHSSRVWPNGLNVGFFSQPQVDELLTAAKTTRDHKKRQQLQQQLHAIIADEQPYSWYIQITDKWGINRRVCGVKSRNTSGLFLWYPGELAWWIAQDAQSEQR
jgi:peptide/nickel transport system substrate-binding protein